MTNTSDRDRLNKQITDELTYLEYLSCSGYSWSKLNTSANSDTDMTNIGSDILILRNFLNTKGLNTLIKE
ncbi:hypothetical protein BpHYR1_033989 [Brachionus plicatilis]|uniref:Uncharacterized protein n=1 Tax=Brachionus plicatilis TaxID=10195 RepID=A0A3M7R3V0_BRAPC|nr:hypothetical protein BpHYR1_033989 [Brachionus plicatilis]